MILKIIILIGLASLIEGSHFRGSYITWTVNKTDPNYFPANPSASNAKLHVRYGTSWRRSDGQSYCTNSSIATCQFFYHGSWNVYYGYSEASQPYYHSSFTAGFYCERFSVAGDFTVGSNLITVYLPKNLVYRARTSSCCWVGYLLQYSSSSWNVEALISLKQRPGGSFTNLNTPPQIEYIPVIKHRLYYYNPYYPKRYTHYRLPVSDPDNDMVKCRWAANFTEGGGIWNSRLGTLHEHNCSLSLDQYPYAYGYTYGWYALAVMVEDFAYDYSSYTYVRLSSIPLQFTVEVRYYGQLTEISGNNSYQCYGNKQHQIVISAPASPAPFSILPTPVFNTMVPTTSSSVLPTHPVTPSLDGCQYYQVLAHPDRLNTYSDWSSYRCDKELYGWYRFMGQAGNRMLNYCPFSNDYSYRCGSYYQGWITSGSLPTVSQGTVSRQVCFSRYGYCSCSYTTSIMIKNCGTFHVYWLNGVPACNSRYCGIKDQSSVVSCTQGFMRIDLDRRYYDYSLYSSITLRSPSCVASYSTSYISLGSVPGSCGATRKDTPNSIIYENEVLLTAKPTNGQITRNLDQKILFSCTFGRNGFVSHVGYKPISSINVTEHGFGNFTFYFWMYTSKSFSTVHSHYPVTVQLRDVLYFEASASVSDSSVVLIMDQCYATPTMDRNHYNKYYFINNRCPTDATVKFHSASRNKQRFEIQAFRFLSNSTAAYIHCLVFLCHSSSTDSRCRHGCAGNNIYRAKREVSSNADNSELKYYMLETSVKLQTNKGGKDRNEGGVSASTFIAIGGLCLLAVVIVGLAVKIGKMKQQNKIRQSPDDHPMENCYVQEEPLPMKEDVKIIGNEEKMTNEDLQQIGVMSPAMQAVIFK